MDKYLRYSGSVAPSGARAWYRDSEYGNFEVWAGPELMWGSSPTLLMQYEAAAP